MIKANSFILRTVSETDLPALHALQANVATRGNYFPIDIPSETEIRKRFHDDGYWGPDNGLLLIVSNEGALIGQIGFFKPGYWNGYELGYLIYEANERGKGIMTEATRLLVCYLFSTRLVNRIQLCIHPDNQASRRVLRQEVSDEREAQYSGNWLTIRAQD
jgi:ribosomal-protein-alanine N-acetyltransferase